MEFEAMEYLNIKILSTPNETITSMIISSMYSALLLLYFNLPIGYENTSSIPALRIQMQATKHIPLAENEDIKTISDSTKLGKSIKSTSKDTLNQNTDIPVEYFYPIEVFPRFPGGDLKCLDYIYSNAIYPEPAIRAKAEGKILVRFLIDKDGHISDANILRGVNYDLNSEALRVVLSMPDWIPAYEYPNEHLNKDSWFYIPISFSLSADTLKRYVVRPKIHKINPECSIYPNPASDYFQIELKGMNDTDKFNYTILSQNGEIKSQGEMYGNITQIDTRNFQSGFYIVVVESIASGFKITEKLIVSH